MNLERCAALNFIEYLLRARQHTRECFTCSVFTKPSDPTGQMGKLRLRVTWATNDSWAWEQAMCHVTRHRRRTKVQLGSSGLCSSCNTSRQGGCACGVVLVCLNDECPGTYGKKLLRWSPKPFSAGFLQALVLVTSGLSGNNKSHFL